MKYMRPEVNALGEAGKLIQDFTKPVSMIGDSLNGNPREVLNPAYDLDE